MSKETLIIFYGTDGAKAKATAKAMHAEGAHVRVHHAEVWGGYPDPCDAVLIMSCVSGHDAGRIRAAYGDKVRQKVPVAEVPEHVAMAEEIAPTVAELPVDLPVPAAVVPPPVPSRKGR